VSIDLSNLRKNERNRMKKIKELEDDIVKYRRELEKTPAPVLDSSTEEEQVDLSTFNHPLIFINNFIRRKQ
jgi:hypothetical protein